jgi:hypothetical protein
VGVTTLLVNGILKQLTYNRFEKVGTKTHRQQKQNPNVCTFPAAKARRIVSAPPFLEKPTNVSLESIALLRSSVSKEK